MNSRARGGARGGLLLAALSLQVTACGSDPAAQNADKDTCQSTSCDSPGDPTPDGGAPDAMSPPPGVTSCARDADCPPEQHCSVGRCILDACEQGTSRCETSDGVAAVRVCAESGNRELRVLCGTDETCSGPEGAARCSNWICVPDEVSCDDEGRIARCAMDGLSVDVEACGSDEACVGGACVDVICTPAAVVCDGPDVVECSPDGTVETVVDTCGTGEYCDEASASCQPGECAPSSRGCVEGKPAECAADGSAWLIEEDCAEDTVCVSGSCLPIVCAPYTLFCGSDSEVLQCSVDGTDSTLVLTCVDGVRHCVESGTGASCVPNDCTPNQPYCGGNVLFTCLPNGAAPTSGTDCTLTGDVCFGGACLPEVCDDGAGAMCIDGDVHHCVDNGSRIALAIDCDPAETYCDAATGTCAPRVCDAGSHTCLGEVYTACNAEGSAYSASPVDCASAQELCSPGGCVTSITDEVGQLPAPGGTSIGSPGFVGTIIDVSQSRTLTKAAIQVLFEETVTLTWAVYEVTGSNFTLIAQASTTEDAFTGLVESSALNVALAVGHRYAIGIYYDPPQTTFSAVFQTCSVAPFSFGEVVGTVEYMADPLPSSFTLAYNSNGCAHREELTTSAP